LFETYSTPALSPVTKRFVEMTMPTRKANEEGMETRKFNWSRRSAIRTAIGAVSAALSLRTSSTQADEKMTREQAQYQDMPNGIYSCGNCSLFERPKSCKVVAGEVSEDGWCKAFALVD
jgi:ribosomal protein S20